MNKKKESLFHRNKKVMENYFFMTILQILNSLLYLLIYPYLIRTLGAESYGLYVFAFSIVTYFSTIINFGFDLPGAKNIAENVNNRVRKEDILSCVFTAKVYLGFFSLVMFSAIIFIIPSLRANWLIFFICFGQSITNILFPQWYFQGIQRMRTVTYIQLGFKLISLFCVFLFVKQKDDVLIFALIMTMSSILGGLMSTFIIRYKDGLVIRWSEIIDVKRYIREALPFFAGNSMNVIKQQSAAVILGSFFSMKDVALYDLAMKVYTVPSVLISSINSALFPKIVILDNLSATVRKILKIENIIGVIIILFLTVFGKWIIFIMGGSSMSDAYPLLVIMSFGILGQLAVGAINNFIFVPMNKSKYIAKSQFASFVTFFSISIIGIWMGKGIFIVPLALMLSAFAELIYNFFIVQSKKMLG
ncbi:MAG: oligosaccharide flippase family protein [Paludibacter sp.]|nr:oligosaccharide flippase family protein [Paludibacter sp.]